MGFLTVRHPENPFTRDALLWNSKALGGKVFNDEQRLDDIIETVENSDDLDNICTLTDLLRTGT